MSNLLIAIDPGLSTGFVVVDRVTAEVIESGELEEFEVSEKVEAYLSNDPDIYIVMEKFTINPETHKKSPQPTAMYLIGSVRYLYKKYTGRIVPLQTPADAKSFSDNKKIRAVGFWHKGGEGHANDAFRHALLYMVRVDRFWDPKLVGEE